MNSNKKTKIVQDIIKLGCSPRNAYRIVHDSKGQAAIALVALIEDLHRRGILVVP